MSLIHSGSGWPSEGQKGVCLREPLHACGVKNKQGASSDGNQRSNKQNPSLLPADRWSKKVST